MTPTPAQVSLDAGRVLDELERAIVGKRDVLELVLAAVLADGHVLLEDVPGVAKTLLARSLAQVTDLEFTRIQFTPDLAPADVTGTTIFDQSRQTFEFRPGPVFCNLLLADEINRAPAKTQASLLEAMEERQVTVDGTTHHLARPFLVIATQNPIDFEGTYPLPEAQVDRFIARLSIGYPSLEDEAELIGRRVERRSDAHDLNRVITREALLAMHEAVEEVNVDHSILTYATKLVHATRDSEKTELGSSPRGSLALVKLARAFASMRGRGYVLPDDVKAVAVPALAHRLLVRPEHWVQGVTGADVVADCLASVATPAPVDPAASISPTS